MHVLKRLFLLLTPYWKTIIISALLLVGRASLELVPPLFQKEIIGTASKRRTASRATISASVEEWLTAPCLREVAIMGTNVLRPTIQIMPPDVDLLPS